MIARRRLALLAVLAASIGAATAAAPAAAQGVDTRPRFVIAVLGDSYASGEGSPDVHGRHSSGGDLFPEAGIECAPIPGLPPTCFAERWWSPDSWFAGRDAVFPQQDDTGWQDAAKRCHRSSKAPGPQAAMLIADRFPDVRVEVLDFACGGSTIGDTCGIGGVSSSTFACAVGDTKPGGVVQPWQGPEPPSGSPADLPPQITALRDYANQTNRDIDAIVANIGGNDAEFDDLVIECLNILVPFDNCTDNATLARIRTKLTPDATGPAFPSPDTPLSERYRAMDAALAASGRARPDELYLTALPNAAHDAPPVDRPGPNPQDLCDGTQTNDEFYKNATQAESAAIEGILTGLNAAMQRAAGRHRWVFMPGLFEAWRAHGICADGASFFRTNVDGQRIQGDEGVPLPHISSGIAHPNEAGYANRATLVADLLEEQVRMRVRPPTLTLDGVEANTAFRLAWADPTPQSLTETWELELASAQSVQRLSSAVAGESAGFSAGSANSFGWRVARQGEFQVRVRACRAVIYAQSYCGAFSNAITVATGVPGTPLDLRRTALSAADLALPGSNPINLAWARGPNTPASARYEVHYGRVGGANCGTEISSCTLLSDAGVANTTSTSTRINLPRAGEWRFRIRACSTAGCSAFSGFLTATVSSAAAPKSPVGTFVVRAPRRARAGKRTRVDIAWRTPKKWTDLDRVDIRVRAGRKQRATIRFSQDDGVLWAIKGKRRRFGHPDSGGRLKAGPVDVLLARSSIVRFGKRSRRVVLRLELVPARAARKKNLTLAISARNDRGRGQRQRFAGVIKVR